jgi:hypothetical protein
LIFFGCKFNKRKTLLPFSGVLVDNSDLDRIVSFESRFEVIFGGTLRNATNKSSVPLSGFSRAGCTDEENSAVHLNVLGIINSGIESLSGPEFDKTETPTRPLAIDPPRNDSGGGDFTEL